MSRKLCTSNCCENTVRLSDLRGRAIKFRRCGNDSPSIGTRWITLRVRLHTLLSGGKLNIRGIRAGDRFYLGDL
jgi:hypothetical protein